VLRARARAYAYASLQSLFERRKEADLILRRMQCSWKVKQFSASLFTKSVESSYYRLHVDRVDESESNFVVNYGACNV